MKKQIRNKRKILAVLMILSMILGLCMTVSADIDYSLSWYKTTRELQLDPGDNWFSIQLENDDGASRHDIYFEVMTEGSHHGLYTELYYNSKSNLITGDPRDFTSLYCLSHTSAAAGWYYLNVHTPNGAIASVTTDKYVTASDQYEPNNRPHFATNIEINQDMILSASQGTNGDDIDYYAYTTTEPCLLNVDLNNSGCELSIYVGDTLVASTDKQEAPAASGKQIKSFPYCFNFISGTCYFKVYWGNGNYQLHVKKQDYEAMPVVYNHSPLNKQLYSEFDILKPKISILGNGTVEANYLYHKNGESYDSETQSQTANTKTFTDLQFPNVLTSQIPDTGTNSINDLQFYVSNDSEAKKSRGVIVRLSYDNQPPSCKDVLVETNKDSIEVSVIQASDEKKLAQRPYRYRIYSSGSTPPEYSEWMTSSYYNKGIDADAGITAGTDYTVEVQIRDKVAEDCKNASQDLSNHILTVTKTAQIR